MTAHHSSERKHIRKKEVMGKVRERERTKNKKDIFRTAIQRALDASKTLASKSFHSLINYDGTNEISRVRS